MDESAESLAACELAGDRCTGGVGRFEWEQRECSVWALAVVVGRVHGSRRASAARNARSAGRRPGWPFDDRALRVDVVRRATRRPWRTRCPDFCRAAAEQPRRRDRRRKGASADAPRAHRRWQKTINLCSASEGLNGSRFMPTSRSSRGPRGSRPTASRPTRGVGRTRCKYRSARLRVGTPLTKGSRADLALDRHHRHCFASRPWLLSPETFWIAARAA